MQMSGFIIQITFNLFDIFEGKYLAPYLHFMTGKIWLQPEYKKFQSKTTLTF